ncbi:ARFIP1 [Cordylochernes scorpioides]|uniref:ARFIP1 n=1 Tax=Cordylochernes scorpioides TaxID=51811 RepID=A0ABY6KA37_9ARAC|nr:ARFIP1 [Cordylochernes scorpioides]
MAISEPKSAHLREVLLFAFNWKKSTTEAHRMLEEVYRDHALSKSQCYRWFKKFQSDDFELDNEPRGKLPQKFEDAELQALLDEDSIQTQEKLAKKLQVSQGAVSLRLNSLGMTQKLSRWVPHELSERQQERCLVTCEGLLARHEKKSFLHRIVTSDEKWIHFSNPTHQKSRGLPGQFPKQTPRPNRFKKRQCFAYGHSPQGPASLFSPCVLGHSSSLNGSGEPQVSKPSHSKIDSLKQWSISAYKCTRQILQEKLGKGSRTVDAELEARIEALRETQRKEFIYYDQDTQWTGDILYGELNIRTNHLGDFLNLLDIPALLSRNLSSRDIITSTHYVICEVQSAGLEVRVWSRYLNVLRLARLLTSHFHHVVQTQACLGEAFGELANRSPELQQEFSYNAETQRSLSKHGETLLGALNFFTSSLNTLCNKTMDDTLLTVRQYENARFLTNEQNLCRLATCEDMFKMTRTDPEWKDKIITGDETWVYGYDPETKRQSAEWRGQDIAPNDFFLFPKLKAVLKGRHFDTREDIIEKSLLALKSIPKEAYKNCFDNWEKRWRCQSLSPYVICCNLYNNVVVISKLSIEQSCWRRLEYDAYRCDLEEASQGAQPNAASSRVEEARRLFALHKEKYENLRSDVTVKMKFLDENRVKVMHKQLLLLHNAVSAYFSGNQAALEATLKQFNIKLRTPSSPSWLEQP